MAGGCRLGLNCSVFGSSEEGLGIWISRGGKDAKYVLFCWLRVLYPVHWRAVRAIPEWESCPVISYLHRYAMSSMSIGD
jgi:hypothetical protein